MNRIQGREISIDPHKKIMWEVADCIVDDTPGKLLTAPEAPPADPAVLFRNFAQSRSSYKKLGSGAYGSVYGVSGYAVKSFDVIDRIDNGNLMDLRPNVILANGLRTVDLPQDVPYTIRGLDIYAAWIPNKHRSINADVESLWLMEKVTEPQKSTTQRPDFDVQRKLYARAVGEYGIQPEAVFYDVKTRDKKPANLMVEHNPQFPLWKTQLVKIDVMGRAGHFNY